MEQIYIDKAHILVEALPYIREFNGITVVIKYGGSALINEHIKKTVMQDIALMKFVGFKPVVVHGGGPEINQALKKIDKKSDFVGGRRVTDGETLEVVEMILAGKVNKALAADLTREGISAVGISGKDAGFIKAKKFCPDGQDIGFVGEIENVNISLIKTLIEHDFVPVISTIGTDDEGNTYNINADDAAVAVAGALRAEKLVFLTDVEGVRENPNDRNSVMSRIKIYEIEEMIASGAISGGMIPKVECCVKGVNAGVSNVHILDGRIEHCLILEIFTKDGIGTLVEK